MANNRLFIFNKQSNEAMLLAKSFGHGWEIRTPAALLELFMTGDDWESSVCGGPSNLVLMTESELPADVTHVSTQSVYAGPAPAHPSHVASRSGQCPAPYTRSTRDVVLLLLGIAAVLFAALAAMINDLFGR